MNESSCTLPPCLQLASVEEGVRVGHAAWVRRGVYLCYFQALLKVLSLFMQGGKMGGKCTLDFIFIFKECFPPSECYTILIRILMPPLKQ